mmetsp:Transcript_70964/g.117922  ORF Transcript_70964/g.117922 Transcript_70964/m.117922 type:complete len:273 (+) Transcript_70964:202-1020(+)
MRADLPLCGSRFREASYLSAGHSAEHSSYAVLNEDIENRANTSRVAQSELRALIHEARGREDESLQDRCSAALSAATKALREFRIELQGVQLPPSQADEQQLDYEEQVEALRQMKRSLELSRAQVVARGAAAEGTRTPHQILAEAANVQANSFESVKRMQKMVQATRQVGAGTAAALASQRDRIERLAATTSAWTHQLATAERQVQRYMSDILADTITLTLIVLIALALIFILVWKLSVPGAHEGEHTTGRTDTRGHDNGWGTLLLPLDDVR